MTISPGEAVLLVVGLVGVGVNAAAFHDAIGTHRWVRRLEGVRAARIARANARRAALRIVASLGAIVVAGLASLAPGRFVGEGLGMGIAIAAGLVAFIAMVTASILDFADKRELHRAVVRELLAEESAPSPRPARPGATRPA
ncbi:MAG TPA: hypothetical protein VID69_08480 [Actinomycetota bacterium]